MKKLFMISTMLVYLAACDAPQRTRAPGTFINGSSLTNPYTGTTVSGSLGGTTTGSTTSGTTTGGTTTTGTGFENCDLTPKYQTPDIGLFGLCQNSVTETLFKFNPTVTSSSIRVCLIPTYKDSTGSSTYIGQPQCTYTTAGTVIQGTLYKDRSGYSNYALNGVIVMREPLLPEYFACMQGYTAWPTNSCTNANTVCASAPSSSACATNKTYCTYWATSCPAGPTTSALCDSNARTYMNQVCTSFKTKYSGAYVDIRTK